MLIVQFLCSDDASLQKLLEFVIDSLGSLNRLDFLVLWCMRFHPSCVALYDIFIAILSK